MMCCSSVLRYARIPHGHKAFGPAWQSTSRASKVAATTARARSGSAPVRHRTIICSSTVVRAAMRTTLLFTCHLCVAKPSWLRKQGACLQAVRDVLAAVAFEHSDDGLQATGALQDKKQLRGIKRDAGLRHPCRKNTHPDCRMASQLHFR